MADAYISDLRIYPIKGCRKQMVNEMPVIDTGPFNDRRLMIIDEKNKFVSQRQNARLATIAVEADGDQFTVTVPNKPPVSFKVKQDEHEAEDAVIWFDQVGVVEQSQKASDLISDYLAQNYRLVGRAQNATRPYVASSKGINFQDFASFTIVSEESLQDLNSRLEQPVPMDRFRPNIVVKGCEAFAEDEWLDFKIGDIEFETIGSDTRCAVTAIDQDTGEKMGNEPLKTLIKYRKFSYPILKVSGTIFGQWTAHKSNGVLKVGQPVEVLSRKKLDGGRYYGTYL